VGEALPSMSPDLPAGQVRRGLLFGDPFGADDLLFMARAGTGPGPELSRARLSASTASSPANRCSGTIGATCVGCGRLMLPIVPRFCRTTCSAIYEMVVTRRVSSMVAGQLFIKVMQTT
jgi:hypothetical protein